MTDWVIKKMNKIYGKGIFTRKYCDVDVIVYGYCEACRRETAKTYVFDEQKKEKVDVCLSCLKRM